MSTDLQLQEPVHFDASTPIVFDAVVTEAKIRVIDRECKALTISGQDDKEGYKIVHDRRMSLVKLRGDIEKRRKELKADALEFGRKVDEVAKHLIGLITPAEEHLKREEDAYNAEKARLKREAEEARQRIVQERLDRLAEIGVMKNPTLIAGIDDAAFEDLFALCKQEADRKAAEAAKEEAERKQREAEEQERLRAERERLDRERKELEELRRKQEQEAAAERSRLEEERRKQDAERERIDAERRAAELEREKLEAAERARQEERDRQERERIEAEQKAEAEARERERAEALRPDREKIAAYLDNLLAVVHPEVSDGMLPVLDAILERLSELVRDMRKELQ